MSLIEKNCQQFSKPEIESIEKIQIRLHRIVTRASSPCRVL
jgi:hypothetical protein